MHFAASLTLKLVASLAAYLLLSGCAQTDDPLLAVAPLAAEGVPATEPQTESDATGSIRDEAVPDTFTTSSKNGGRLSTEEAQLATADSPSGADARGKSKGSASEPAPAKAAFEPPYPDRIDLFAAPKRKQTGPRQGDDDSHAVELVGFVRVDLPRAVLMIDGQIAPVAVGDTRYGVEVLSIRPPTVVLQRGRERLEATLAN